MAFAAVFFRKSGNRGEGLRNPFGLASEIVFAASA
jgi:hypothetical protein